MSKFMHRFYLFARSRFSETRQIANRGLSPIVTRVSRIIAKAKGKPDPEVFSCLAQLEPICA